MFITYFFEHPNNKKARGGCGLFMCNAYALASYHPIEGDNHHAGGDCCYFFHVRNLPYRRLYVNWQVKLFCYL